MPLGVLQLTGITAHMFLILTFVLVMFGVVITLYLTYLGHKSDIHSPAIAQDDGEDAST